MTEKRGFWYWAQQALALALFLWVTGLGLGFWWNANSIGKVILPLYFASAYVAAALLNALPLFLIALLERRVRDRLGIKDPASAPGDARIPLSPAPTGDLPDLPAPDTHSRSFARRP